MVVQSISPSSPLPSPNLTEANSRRRKKKYVRQVTGRLNNTELHVAAQRGDLAVVRRILREAVEEAEAEGEEEEVRAAVVGEVNEAEETAVMVAAEWGFVDVVRELVGYLDRECFVRTNRAGLDALHLAARGGHKGEKLVILSSCFASIISHLHSAVLARIPSHAGIVLSHTIVVANL